MVREGNMAASVESRPQSRPAEAAPDAPLMLEQVLGSMGIGAIAFDANWRVVWQNDTARRLLPATGNVLDALRAAAFEQPVADWESILRGAVEGGSPRRLDALCSLADPKEPRYFRMVIAPQRAAAGLLIIEDVTDRTTLERRLAVSERLAALG